MDNKILLFLLVALACYAAVQAFEPGYAEITGTCDENSIEEGRRVGCKQVYCIKSASGNLYSELDCPDQVDVNCHLSMQKLQLGNTNANYPACCPKIVCRS